MNTRRGTSARAPLQAKRAVGVMRHSLTLVSLHSGWPCTCVVKGGQSVAIRAPLVVTNAKRRGSTTADTYGTRGYDEATMKRLQSEDQGGRRLATSESGGGDVARGKKSGGKESVEGALPWLPRASRLQIRCRSSRGEARGAWPAMVSFPGRANGRLQDPGGSHGLVQSGNCFCTPLYMYHL